MSVVAGSAMASTAAWLSAPGSAGITEASATRSPSTPRTRSCGSTTAPVGWIRRGSRRERIEFEWIDRYAPGPVTLTEAFGSVRPKAPAAAASNFFGGYALEGRQRERLTQRRGISDPTDLYAMLREFGSSIAGAVTIADPDAASRTKPRYEPISDGEIFQRLRRAASDGDLGSDDQSRSMLAGLQPKLLLARFGDHWYLPHGRGHSTHILKPRLPGRPDGLAREHYGHALAIELGLAHYRTALVGTGARQYLVIERFDRAVRGETVTLVHQEDAAQALGLGWVDDQAKFQNPDAPRGSRRPSAYRIAELLGSLQGEASRSPTSSAGSPSPCSSVTTTPTRRISLSCTCPAAASSRTSTTRSRTCSSEAGSATTSPSTAASTTGRISAAHLIREGERWNALGAGEAERIVTSTLADFAMALDHQAVPQGVPAAAVAQLAWNVERLQSGWEIGERPSGYRRRPNRSSLQSAHEERQRR
jgi:serine/threonine-protein kinase HipA